MRHRRHGRGIEAPRPEARGRRRGCGSYATRKNGSCVSQVETPLNTLDARIIAVQLTRHTHISILQRTDRSPQFTHVFAHSVERAADVKKVLQDFMVSFGHAVRLS